MCRGPSIAAGSKWLCCAVVLLFIVAPVGGLESSTSTSNDGPNHQYAIHGEKCPQYYLIGDLACGSSILLKYLQTELDIEGLADQNQKSLHAFDRLDAPRALASFKETPIIDGTPSMLRSVDAPFRLKAFCDFKEPPKFVVSVCDPAARTWSMYKHKTRGEQQRHTYYNSTASALEQLDGEIMSAYYRSCIKLTLPQLKKCMEKMGNLRDCSHALYGDSTPGAMEIDALGNKAPCNGVIFSSMYKGLLDNWFSVFPREDFLVLYGDDWIDFKQQPAVISSIATHFGVPLKQKDFSNFEVDPDTIDQYWEKDEIVAAPEDVQDELREFFSHHNGWQHHINVTGGNRLSNAVLQRRAAIKGQ